MNNFFTIFFSFLLFFLGCSNEYTFIEPDTQGLLTGTTAISQPVINLIEGVYTVEEGNTAIGDKVVIKFSSEYATVFGGGRIDYFLLKHGQTATTIVFEGYSRVAENILTGAVNLNISAANLSALLLGDDSDLVITGEFQQPTLNSESTKQVDLVLKKSQDLVADNFYVVAHRGGGRNSDYLNISENSLDMIKFSEALGANAVELDVRLTSDNIPIIFHDEEFTSRTIQGDFLIGEVSNYTFKHIRAFGRLKYGEKIPTLDEALNTLVADTEHKLVWLDLKSPKVLDVILPIINKYKTLASEETRDLEIAIGIPDSDIKNKFLELAAADRPTAICELSTSTVTSIGADFWAPRWTNGQMTEEVTSLHSKGIEVIPWTMDDRTFIRKYLQETDFDGILTNYPVIVAYEHWIK
ncbi:MAG: hypothetical protein A2504_02255 [Bdellovibrionales bacterium RIFOXYD12_FULL_39_22]|nr:MAG: hypothetical protein A2385_12280 [Bdellovibrionales bacterium RIFOXYB1_FULL_39_21]OFZ41418.1 MAG: hypothetical protein A2485_01450 [Bdellovibrionales bacterium RIFOXYC12_FULL_39_17]OFZ45373.1 MAG: hypothetical protein A2404_13465 [Bdellovibrionales bacterium RIFOXYC1_FULL_39_130]OFZ74569.1 MAG: hypothetical protein A2560_12570 [Bdellovibrionales bacterium RIFOXYD1_FULL_39_84]OFZ74861.1 MAG: hypothetical protein A2451_04615 [Bdellovibrionales bacterium RIFOXYC2_FULL_39_8]OFZ92578.1 MAG: